LKHVLPLFFIFTYPNQLELPYILCRCINVSFVLCVLITVLEVLKVALPDMFSLSSPSCEPRSEAQGNKPKLGKSNGRLARCRLLLGGSSRSTKSKLAYGSSVGPKEAYVSEPKKWLEGRRHNTLAWVMCSVQRSSVYLLVWWRFELNTK